MFIPIGHVTTTQYNQKTEDMSILKAIDNVLRFEKSISWKLVF